MNKSKQAGGNEDNPETALALFIKEVLSEDEKMDYKLRVKVAQAGQGQSPGPAASGASGSTRADPSRPGPEPKPGESGYDYSKWDPKKAPQSSNPEDYPEEYPFKPNQFYDKPALKNCMKAGWSPRPKKHCLPMDRTYEVPEVDIWTMNNQHDDHTKGKAQIQYMLTQMGYIGIAELLTEGGLPVDDVMDRKFKVAFTKSYKHSFPFGGLSRCNFPAEIGVITFSLKEGITHVFHRHIKFTANPDRHFETDFKRQSQMLEKCMAPSGIGIDPLEKDERRQEVWKLCDNYEALWEEVIEEVCNRDDILIMVPREDHNDFMAALHWIYYQAFGRFLFADQRNFLRAYRNGRLRYWVELMDSDLAKDKRPEWASGALASYLYWIRPARFMMLEDFAFALAIVGCGAHPIRAHLPIQTDARNANRYGTIAEAYQVVIAAVMQTEDFPIMDKYTFDEHTACEQHFKLGSKHRCGLGDTKKKLYALFTICKDWFNYPLPANCHRPLPLPPQPLPNMEVIERKSSQKHVTMKGGPHGYPMPRFLRPCQIAFWMELGTFATSPPDGDSNADHEEIFEGFDLSDVENDLVLSPPMSPASIMQQLDVDDAPSPEREDVTQEVGGRRQAADADNHAAADRGATPRISFADFMRRDMEGDDVDDIDGFGFADIEPPEDQPSTSAPSQATNDPPTPSGQVPGISVVQQAGKPGEINRRKRVLG